jgi:hypothetical protein
MEVLILAGHRARVVVVQSLSRISLLLVLVLSASLKGAEPHVTPCESFRVIGCITVAIDGAAMELIRAHDCAYLGTSARNPIVTFGCGLSHAGGMDRRRMRLNAEKEIRLAAVLTVGPTILERFRQGRSAEHGPDPPPTMPRLVPKTRYFLDDCGSVRKSCSEDCITSSRFVLLEPIFAAHRSAKFCCRRRR